MWREALGDGLEARTFFLTYRPLPLAICLTLKKVGPGDPAAHRTDRLPLLPSGPGGVHRVLLHRAQPLKTLMAFLRRAYLEGRVLSMSGIAVSVLS